MTRDEQFDHAVKFFEQAHAKFCLSGLQLIDLKGSDYAPEPIAMTEVFFTAADLKTDAPQVLWVHVRKHLSAIVNYMQGHTLRSEDLRSRLVDVANYMALIDSYVVDPWRWLTHLETLIHLSEFPNRSKLEIDFLKLWIAHQKSRFEFTKQ